jgi:hypothetical protein
MVGTRERAVRSAIAALVLPHELGHALLARLFRLETEVTLLPSWDGDPAPLARVNATLDADTPTPVIRAVAVAPLPLALAAAWAVGAVLPPESPLVVPVLLALSFWGSLSSGDLAIAARPRFARRQGEFLAPRSPTVDAVALSLTPLTVVAVGTLLLRSATHP